MRWPWYRTVCIVVDSIDFLGLILVDFLTDFGPRFVMMQVWACVSGLLTWYVFLLNATVVY